MFDSLSDRLNGVFTRLRAHGRLTEKDVDEAMREVQRALLEADVNFRVVKKFVATVREKAIGEEILKSLSPGEQVIKVVNDELIALLGGDSPKLNRAPQPPTIIMLVGLQGSGKTTTAAKLALHLRKGSSSKPLLVAADVYRPAAVNQLIALGKQLDIPVYSEGTDVKPLAIVQNALRRARELNASFVILDTAGRLHIDDAMMKEVAEIKQAVRPNEVLLVADAMTGQDAVRAADEFHQKVGVTGLILTKMDGDARGGAALSIKQVTGVPIKFLGTGEKTDALEPFHPDRLANRILGMGDVLTLIERAQENIDQEQALAMQKKLQKGSFDLEDFLKQLQQLKKMGPLGQLVDMIPGMRQMTKGLPSDAQVNDKDLKKIEAIIYSMTPQERRNPNIIDGSRRRRIARGSGTTPQDVNQLLNQFKQMQKMMKQLTSGKGGGLARMLTGR